MCIDLIILLLGNLGNRHALNCIYCPLYDALGINHQVDPVRMGQTYMYTRYIIITGVCISPFPKACLQAINITLV